MTRDSFNNAFIQGKFPRRILLVAVATMLLNWEQSLHAQSAVASGAVITIAGNGAIGFSGDGGPATNASLKYAYGLAVGRDGTLYIADVGNNRIRALHPTNGLITTIASTGTDGDYRGGIAVDRQRNALYLDGHVSRYVFKVDLATGGITNFAGVGPIDPYPVGAGYGDGHPATEAWFDLPIGIAVGSANNVFIADLSRSNIRKVTGATGIVSTVAGIEDAPGVPNSDHSGDGGPAVAAGLALPYSLAADRAGNVFVLESDGGRIRRIDAATGIITTVAGGGTMTNYSGPATNMDLINSRAIAVSGTSDLFVANPNQILRVDLATGLLTVFAGTGEAGFSGDGGSGLNARFWDIWGLTVPPGGGLLISDQVNERIRYIAPDSINLVEDNGQTSFYLPWVNGLAGDLVISKNPNLTNLIAGTLSRVGGSLNVSGNDAVGTIDLGSLISVGSIAISSNTSAHTINVGSLETTTGSVSIEHNVDAGTVDLGALTNVGGSININGNNAVGSIDLGSLLSVTGSVSIENNLTAGTVDVGSLTDSGSINVNGNAAAGKLDLRSLLSVTGSLIISNNCSATNIDLSLLSAVGGDVSVIADCVNAVIQMSGLTNFGTGTNAATLTLDGGTVELTNGLTLETNATLAGSSTIDGSITNNGVISPGASAGHIQILGNVVLGNTSRLRMELGGYSASEFDSLNIGASVTLGGVLSLRLMNNFPGSMTNGASFTLLTAGALLSGMFANVPSGGTLFTSDGYARFTVRYAGENTLRLTDLVVVDSDNDGMPDWWEDRFGLNRMNSADALIDTDADGATNYQEYFAGTKPNDASSIFRIVSVRPEFSNLRISWSTVGGKSYVVQATPPLTNGSLANNFADLSPLIYVEGAGESITNIVDLGGMTNSAARYYRVRLGL